MDSGYVRLENDWEFPWSGKGRTMKKLGLLVACALVCFACGSVAFASEAYAADLTVKCVIDNIDEYPDQSDTAFTYRYGTFTRLVHASKQDKSSIFIPDESRKVFTWKHGQTQTISLPNRGSVVFNPAYGTAPQLSLTSIEHKSGVTSYHYDNNGRAGVPCTAFNWVTMTASQGEVTLHFRYTGGLKSTQFTFDPKMTYQKQIDYLGDGVTNADTARTGENDYRLYLNATTDDNSVPGYKSKNIIFVLDTSGSMASNMGGSSRIERLRTQVVSMIDAISVDSNNRYSVVSFSSGATVKLNKGSADQAKSVVRSLKAQGGTAYYDALNSVSGLLAGGDKENVLIFVSDGQPTSMPGARLGGRDGWDACGPVALIYAEMAAKNLSGVDSMYSIFIGTDTGAASTLQTVTQKVNTTGEKASVMVSDPAELQKVIDALTKKIVKPTSAIVITDDLTQYVNYYGGSVKVTRQPSGGSPATLQSGKDYTVAYDSATKSVKIELLCSIDSFTTYTASFDVRTSAQAIKAWLAADENYPDIGEPNTDYTPTGNATSSGKPGFFTSDTATVSANWEGGSASYTYAKPVVQVTYNPHVKSQISAHVTLYNMLLTDNMFEYQLLDADGNLIETVGNDKDGEISFSNIDYKREGTWHYQIKPIVPAEGETGWIKHMTYDDRTIDVTVVVEAEESGMKTHVTYAPAANFYCSYALRGTFQ